ncbi:hypothetical protein B0T10DRAFT_237347 [Thelonectria olida]|uniref:RING-type domain-containing protein n=1 Tax=Thelonectria olida TaxID=1576542 RepID=A0A9P8W9C2_9HYPO|nr:hypothetical protein B0T10DRAFT_237347 [Thelonectria olida]
MRPPRIAILIFFLTAALFLTFRSLSSPPRSVAGSSSTYPATSTSSSSNSKSQTQTRAKSKKKAWGFMYYNTPFSLFPPNAAISLTDDNSTSFPARPAAFGPKLIAKGLSGQLWVGNGFAEDTLGSGAELGCSDLPGWGKGTDNASVNKALREAIPQAAIPRFGGPNQAKKRSIAGESPIRKTSSVTKNVKPNAPARKTRPEDDIKGKIVLVMRGGCGFLDKVLWAQRRGAIGVIVGDNQKGGPLIQMFAHGPEVDNVTIPSVFTARTTAQILSSLTRPGSFIEESLDAQGNPVFRVQKGSKPTRVQKQGQRKQKSSQMTDTGSPFAKRSTIASDMTARFSQLIRWARPTASVPADGGNGLEKRMTKHARNTFDGTNGESEPSTSLDENNFISSKIVHDEDGDREAYDITSPSDNLNVDDFYFPEPADGPVHDGLWVTITPTSNASPFFDTLLVLVISPLVTLTVVYAMLILRARIRRRRWRAPKSVVEQLPVRTYHTVAPSPTDTPRTPSPTSTSPTTPLLQDAPAQPRPRSKPGSQESETEATPSAAVPTPASGSQNPPRNEREKGSGGFSGEWKKYMGRQVECVVCLEEYVDGESQVMALPCGHEFHVECITPWLTTRRRTCPICKGDVVRSLAHGPSSEPLYEPYRDDNEDDGPIAEGSGTRFGRDPDLESGFLPPEPRLPRGWTRPDNWMSAFSNSFGAPRSLSPEDRTR